MQQAFDFRDESAALADLLAPLSNDHFERKTLFKRWTINNVLRHLHVWNIAAHRSLQGEDDFRALMKQLMSGGKGIRFTEVEANFLNDLSGQDLLAAWLEQIDVMTSDFASADPKHRVKWVGPDMSVLSSITARLMETWAHAQAVYDLLGIERQNGDRIGNIVRLGINTYGWTFKNRKEDVPEPMPYLRLTAPSGAIWEYGDESQTERIEGRATEFCQVVTQCRNIADTALSVTGANATRWMDIAQCFAGPPNDPPGAGKRRTA